MTPSWPSILTHREVEVADLLARGYTPIEISARLGISERTSSTHRLHVLDKLGLRDAVALARWALREGLVSGAVEADAPARRKTVGRQRMTERVGGDGR